MVDKGNHRHANAIELCKKLNARLPLPRNQEEADEFAKISANWTNVDARNPKKTADGYEWIDAEGKPLGNRPVHQRGHKFYAKNDNSFTINFYFKYDFFKSGHHHNRKRVIQLLIII